MTSHPSQIACVFTPSGSSIRLVGAGPNWCSSKLWQKCQLFVICFGWKIKQCCISANFQLRKYIYLTKKVAMFSSHLDKVLVLDKYAKKEGFERIDTSFLQLNMLSDHVNSFFRGIMPVLSI